MRHEAIPGTVRLRASRAALPLALGLVGAACLAGIPARAADQATAPLVPRAVTVAKAKRTCVPVTILVTGNVVPKSEIQVRPDRAGLQMAQILVEPGQTVTSGQVLAKLEQMGAPSGAPTVDVTSPAAGMVLAVSGLVGAPVLPSGDPMFRIARAGELELAGNVAVASMERLAPDQSAKVEIIGVGDIGGKVRLVSASINPVTQLGQVTITLDSDQRIRSGVFGQARIDVDQTCRSAIPLSAVLFGPGGAIVQVVRTDKIETRSVKIGRIRGATADIRQGLADGEIVVARAGSFVRDGDQVRPVMP